MIITQFEWGLIWGAIASLIGAYLALRKYRFVRK